MQIVKTKNTAIPPRIIIYGSEGIGKSTFAASAPSPVFIQTEDGLRYIDADSAGQPKSFKEFCKVFDELSQHIKDTKSFSTFVVDTIDGLEQLIAADIAERNGVKTIGEIKYGRGYTELANSWGPVLRRFEYLQQLGVLVILIAHSSMDRIDNAEGMSYKKIVPAVSEKSLNIISAWADIIGHCHRRIAVVETGEDVFGAKRKVAQPIGKDGGDRVIRFGGGPSFLAKSRCKIPSEIPLSFPEFWQYAKGEK